MSTIVEKIQQIHQQIDEACRVAGRPVGSVALLAVSKTFGVDAIADAIAAGQQAFGENRTMLCPIPLQSSPQVP